MTERVRLSSAIGAWEWLCLAVFLSLICCQLFVRPITGVSDNNDFSKVFGPAHVCPAPYENLNSYFVSSYSAGLACKRPSGFVSSEVVFVDVARWLSRPFTGRNTFDLRASAALHLLVLAVALALFLSVTRRQSVLVRFLLPPIAIIMFTDVAYVSYLNSAYMDNASWVLLLLLATIAAMACMWPELRWTAPAYGVVGVLLVFSKAQHAMAGMVFAGLAAYFAWRHPGRRMVWSIGAGALLISALAMPVLTPQEYRTISLYNLIFSALAPADRMVLPQIGLDQTYEKWIGMNAFSPGSPIHDPDWTRDFDSKVAFSDVALLYGGHPELAFHLVRRAFEDDMHSMRPSYLANYRQADGYPPHSVATRFSFWSSLRMDVLVKFPYAILVLYGLPLVACLGRVRGGAFLPLAVTLAAAGVGEFAVCTLADGFDTHRHLFLFHVITEAVILMTVGWFLGALSNRRQGSLSPAKA